jgi:hypothetical protein
MAVFSVILAVLYRALGRKVSSPLDPDDEEEEDIDELDDVMYDAFLLSNHVH